MPISLGKDQNAAKVATCKDCGTINQYYPGEVRELWQGKDYSGGSDGAEGFNCIDCNKPIVTKRW